MPSVAPKKRPKDVATRADQMNRGILLYSILLALQYGAQPLISKRFTRCFLIFCSFNLCAFFGLILVVEGWMTKIYLGFAPSA